MNLTSRHSEECQPYILVCLDKVRQSVRHTLLHARSSLERACATRRLEVSFKCPKDTWTWPQDGVKSMRHTHGFARRALEPYLNTAWRACAIHAWTNRSLKNIAKSWVDPNGGKEIGFFFAFLAGSWKVIPEKLIFGRGKKWSPWGDIGWPLYGATNFVCISRRIMKGYTRTQGFCNFIHFWDACTLLFGEGRGPTV